MYIAIACEPGFDVINFKGLSMKQITQIFLEGESLTLSLPTY